MNALPNNSIRIRGARSHNLKNVSVDLPREKLIVLTGPSGSGKSSLAFDTLFAEGQRQYLESLSAFTRRFLDQMQRPDIDSIEGLQPTICIDQRAGHAGPRSTVGTLTEIYDYLRLLYARLGVPKCSACGQSIRQQSPEEITRALLALPEKTKLMLLAPLLRNKPGDGKSAYSAIRKGGFVRVRVDGVSYEIDEAPLLDPEISHAVEAVVDRIVLRSGLENRLTESLRLALRHGDGTIIAVHQNEQGEWIDTTYSTLYACPTCSVRFADLEPRTFSFNSPCGACPECEGLGNTVSFPLEAVFAERHLSLAAGAVAPWKSAAKKDSDKHAKELAPLVAQLGFDFETPLEELTDDTLAELFYDEAGVLNMLEKEYATAIQRGRVEFLDMYRDATPCRACEGSRLRAEGRNVFLNDLPIHVVSEMPISQTREFLTSLEFEDRELKIAQPIITDMLKRLDFLDRVGAGYLTLQRTATSLSGGELQRVRLAAGVGSGVVGSCYVLDEPSIGLHPRDNDRLIGALRDLQARGNTVVVVEHDEEIMRQADWLIDIGPGAGEHGGKIVAQGAPADVIAGDSLTGRFLAGREKIDVPEKRRRLSKNRSLTIEGATMNNLQSVSARFPLEALVCVTGVSGSGKSSLVNDTLGPAMIHRLGQAARPGPFTSLRGVSNIDKVIRIDQSPIGRTPRSNAATHSGAFDEIRKVFAAAKEAKRRGFRASRFSFNAKAGRCEECLGHGVKKIEMNFLPDLYVTCGSCNGTRYNQQTLSVTWRGKTIANVLAMSVDEALDFFANVEFVRSILAALADVGLGYLPLGQPSTTISGGEAQRIKLATQLARPDTGKTVYLLDEPTTGLHSDDIRRLLKVIDRLVDRGNTMIVIEHHLDVIKRADWVIDMGPEGGAGGGKVLVEGTPETIAACEASITGRFLRDVL